ncbi:MAG TPA: malate dehydrogenase [Armatimonadetes bacterium]|nr:malate dehydrogenase [Armatimonadota bacterium]
MAKIAVIGAGNVGATLALELAERELGEVVMVDIVEGMPQGKALDMLEASPLHGFDVKIRGTNNYSDIEGADVVVVTAGAARRPGMSREDLLETNARIVKSVCEEIRRRAPKCVLVMVTNPLDVMTHVALRVTGFEPERVVGMAGVLDSARFRFFVAEELGVSVRDVQAMVLGGHGDDMVPLPRYTTISGVPITQLLPPGRIERIVERVRQAGTEIVSLLGTGSAFYSPGASAAEMVEAIVRDRRRLLPCSAYLRGEFGLSDVYCGVPVILGAGGVREIVEVELSEAELSSLRRSAERVREATRKAFKILGLEG